MSLDRCPWRAPSPRRWRASWCATGPTRPPSPTSPATTGSWATGWCTPWRSRPAAPLYRNRWVRTRKLAGEIGTKPPRGPLEPLDGPANTHVVWHGGRLLALVESGFPHRLTTGLETVAVEDFDGGLTSPMTAHPHTDPDTGGMALFGYDLFGPPYLRYHELDAAGQLVHSTEVVIPRATMQHDFGVTATRVAFLDLPVVFDPDLVDRSMPFRWVPEAGARIGVLDRGDRGTAVRWVGLDPCYAFHVMNAFDDGPAVVLDVCRYDRTFDTGPGRADRLRPPDPRALAGRPGGRDGRDGPVSTTGRWSSPGSPTTLAGRPYRYGYCTETGRVGGMDTYDALVRYDLPA